MIKMKNLHKKAVLMAVLAALAGPAYATVINLPTGDTFTDGSAGTVTISGDTENINVSSVSTSATTTSPGGIGAGQTNSNGAAGPAVIDWSGGFDVGSGYTVNFGSASGVNTDAYINVDESGNPSEIAGTITSNDAIPVFVINPDGITVAGTADLSSMPIGLIAGSVSGDVITGTSAAVTVDSGVSVYTNSTDEDGSSVTETLASGDTLPVGLGYTTYTEPSSVPGYFPDNMSLFNFLLAVPAGDSSYNLTSSDAGNYTFDDNMGAATVNIGNSSSVSDPFGGIELSASESDLEEESGSSSNQLGLNVSLDNYTLTNGGIVILSQCGGDSTTSIDNASADGIVVNTGGFSTNTDEAYTGGEVNLSGAINGGADGISVVNNIVDGDLNGSILPLESGGYPINIAAGTTFDLTGTAALTMQGSGVVLNGTESAPVTFNGGVVSIDDVNGVDGGDGSYNDFSGNYIDANAPLNIYAGNIGTTNITIGSGGDVTLESNSSATSADSSIDNVTIANATSNTSASNVSLDFSYSNDYTGSATSQTDTLSDDSIDLSNNGLISVAADGSGSAASGSPGYAVNLILSGTTLTQGGSDSDNELQLYNDSPTGSIQLTNSTEITSPAGVLVDTLGSSFSEDSTSSVYAVGKTKTTTDLNSAEYDSSDGLYDTSTGGGNIDLSGTSSVTSSEANYYYAGGGTFTESGTSDPAEVQDVSIAGTYAAGTINVYTDGGNINIDGILDAGTPATPAQAAPAPAPVAPAPAPVAPAPAPVAPAPAPVAPAPALAPIAPASTQSDAMSVVNGATAAAVNPVVIKPSPYVTDIQHEGNTLLIPEKKHAE